MAPKWLQRHDDSGRRISVFSTIANSRREIIDSDDSVPPLPTQSPFLEEEPPTLDDRVTRDLPSNGHRSLSRKRYSFFSRSATTDDIVEPVTDVSHDAPGRSYFDHDDTSATAESEEESRLTYYRKRSSRYFKPRSDNTLRWIKSDEPQPRPATAHANLGQDDRVGLKKASISAPFNFQHITHTQHKELPRLDAVDDRDLMVNFWAASAQQLPQSDLRGINANAIYGQDDLADKCSLSVASRPTSPLTGASPTFKFSNGPLARVADNGTGRVRSSSKSTENLQSGSLIARQRSHSTLRSRSASLASLVTEQRSPPTMVHPALRDLTEPSSTTSSRHNSMSPITQSEASESNRFLDVVPEEREGASSPSSPVKRFERRRTSSDAHTLQQFERPAEEQEQIRDTRTDSADSLDFNDMSGLRSWKRSLPSLCSGDSWEEDVDYCYNMEAESTCDFEFGRLAGFSPNPHDSVLPMPCKTFSQDGADVSPRTSIAHHQRQKSSMTLQGLFPVVKVEDQWGTPDAFENPRHAPMAPLTSIPRWSLFDIPLIHTPITLSPTFKTGHSDATIRELFPSVDDSVIPDRRLCDAAHAQTSLLASVTAVRGHIRAKSADNNDHGELAQKLSQRWSSIPPSQMPASRVSLEQFKCPVLPSRPASHGQPLPPPTMPLPPIPQTAKTLLALKRSTFAATTEYQVMMRRPQTSADRSLLQAAGRTVQRERSSRPQSRICHTPTPSQPTLRDLMARSQSSPDVAHFPAHVTHDMPVEPQTFPAWI